MLEAGAYKEAFSAVAFGLTFVLFVPYIRSILQGLTVPHVFSWIIWAFGTFVVFFAQLVGGAGVGAWPIGFSACITSYVAFLAYARRDRTRITSLDWTLLALALLALPSWVATSDPLWALDGLSCMDLPG